MHCSLYRVTALQRYSVTALKCYNVTALQCYSVTVLQTGSRKVLRSPSSAKNSKAAVEARCGLQDPVARARSLEDFDMQLQVLVCGRAVACAQNPGDLLNLGDFMK